MSVWCAIATLTPAAAPLHVPPSARAERALRAVGAQLALPQPPPERISRFGSSFATRRKATSTLDSAGEVMQSLARRIGCQKARRIGFSDNRLGWGSMRISA